MDKETYFFYEWLILAKGFSKEDMANTTPEEKQALVNEYAEFKHKLQTINPY